MIELYTGFIGSGKSYHAVRRGTLIADAPAGKRWVVANFPIKKRKKFIAKLPIIKNRIKNKYVESRWIYKDNDELSPEYLVQLSMDMGWYGNEGSALLIIDEAGIMFNSRDWNVRPQQRKEWIQFLTQSRKLGYDVIFIVQDARMIDRQIRNLAEYEVQHKKLNRWGLFKFLPFTLFAAIKFWNGLRNLRGSVEFFIYRKSIAERYDTKALFGYGEEYLAGGEGVPASAGGSLPTAKLSGNN